jgi:uncharacterized protein (TIGR03067 family)
MAGQPRFRSVPTGNDLPAQLEDFWDEPDDSAVPADLAALQGAWESIAGRREAEFLVSGNHFTLHFGDGDIYMGRFTLDANAWPKRMEMAIEEGPKRHRGLTSLCIFELDGDQLHWCTTGPGQTQRPTTFPSEEDQQCLCLLFRREKVRPRP